MAKELIELVKQNIDLVADIGKLKGELTAVKEENIYLRELLKDQLEKRPKYNDSTE